MRRIGKRILGICLCLLLMVLIPVAVFAEDIGTKSTSQILGSGSCGNNATWKLTADGTLTISGTGNMNNYSYSSNRPPWNQAGNSLTAKIKAIVIESGITSVGSGAFHGCSKVVSISLPDTITAINNYAFNGCAMTSVVVPYGVRIIDYFAFAHCENMQTIVIPNTVRMFGSATFYGCEALRFCIIPEGVKLLDDNLFSGCSLLEYVQLPATLKEIEWAAFEKCGMLSDVYFTGSRSEYNAIDIGADNDGLEYATIHYNSKSPCVVCTYGGWSSINSNTHQRSCTNCGKTETTNHNWKAGPITKQPSCKETGTQEYSCSTCGGKKTVTLDTTNHIFGNWTKVSETQHTHTCTVCQKEETINHNWDKSKTIKQPNCIEGGQIEYTCTACSTTKIEDIDKTTTHSYGKWTKVSDTQHTHTCTVCRKEETTNHTWNSGTVTKKANCKETGVKTYTCTGCSTTKTETIAKLTTHTYDHGCDTDCNVCGKTRSTSHKYSSSWSKDKSNHWHICTECRDKKDVAKHTPGADATETTPQRCTLCGYIIKPALGHTHNYATTWTTDEHGHWYTCSGCEEKGSYKEHDFENACDKDCSICGYTRETGHVFEEKWTNNATNHWHVCTGCGIKQDEAAHEAGAEATATTAQTCTICGYEISPALGGNEETQPTTDPADPVETNGVVIGIVIAAIVVIGGIVVGVVIWKKKH